MSGQTASDRSRPTGQTYDVMFAGDEAPAASALSTPSVPPAPSAPPMSSAPPPRPYSDLGRPAGPMAPPTRPPPPAPQYLQSPTPDHPSAPPTVGPNVGPAPAAIPYAAAPSFTGSETSSHPGNLFPGDGTYEVILEALATVSEQSPGTLSESGPMKVIQGQRGPNQSDGYHAFLAIGTLNVPLVPSCSTSRVGQGKYVIYIPNDSLVLEFDPRTESHLVSGFESILAWFTTWEDATGPNGAAATAGGIDAPPPLYSSPPEYPHSSYPYVTSSNSMDATTAAAVQEPIGTGPVDVDGASNLQRMKSKLEEGGNRGVEIVNRLGERVNSYMATHGEKAVAQRAQTPSKDVKLGGAATATVLNGAKTVVSFGAGVAAKVIDTVSNTVENRVARSKALERMRSAPIGSSERDWYDVLTSGSIAVGRVYLAADHQGRLICECAGNNASRLAGAKYGPEAQHATHQAALIALDTYRIVRFPTRLGATTLLKGAIKGAGVKLTRGPQLS